MKNIKNIFKKFNSDFKNNNTKNLSAGFTLIELLIVISIISILAVTSLPVFDKLYYATKLDEGTSFVLQELRTAKSLSASGYMDTSYGVFFDSHPVTENKIVFYQGDSYATRDSATDRVNILDKGVILFLNLPQNDINFKNGTGIPNATGTIQIKFLNNKTNTVILDEHGISLEE